MSKESIEAVVMQDENALLGALIDGAIAFVADPPVAVLVICPCGCGTLMRLPIHRGEHPPGVSWLWDGNKEKPTLTPSIRDLGGCRYHGFLKAGVWTFCSDSGKR